MSTGGETNRQTDSMLARHRSSNAPGTDPCRPLLRRPRRRLHPILNSDGYGDVARQPQFAPSAPAVRANSRPSRVTGVGLEIRLRLALIRLMKYPRPRGTAWT